MRFTPFHMGPGLAIQAVAGYRFSVLTLGVARVAMDIEPLVGMIRGPEVLHGATHACLAALRELRVAFGLPGIVLWIAASRARRS